MNIRVKALFMIVIAAGWASCKKNNDAPTVPLTTSVNLVNASNNTINFFVNGTRISSANNTSSYSPGGTLGYINTIISGTQNYQVKIAGGNTPNPLFSVPLTFDTGKLYSLYASGQTAESLFFTEDVLAISINGDSTLVRFVNASSDAGPLILAFQTGTPTSPISAPQFSNISYKTTTGFIKIKSGIRNLGIYRSAAPEKPATDTVTLSGGRIYTILSYGSTSTAGNQGLGTSLIVNK